MKLIDIRMLYIPEEYTFPAELKIVVEAYKKDLERAVSHRDQYGGQGKTYDRYKNSIKHAGELIRSLDEQITSYPTSLPTS